MADRVKYFLLGLLVLIVVGAVAYDRWNRVDEPDDEHAADDRATVGVGGAEEDAIDDQPPLVIENEDELDSRGTGLQGARRSRSLDPDDRGAAQPPEATERSETTGGRETEREQPVVRPDPPIRREEPEPAPVVVERRVHEVAGGETLEKIALRYYGTRKGIQVIADANDLRDPNLIFKGQKLVIPTRTDLGSPVPEIVSTRKPGANEVPRTYRVKPEDGDLYQICRRFYGRRGEGARVARIMELNGLWTADVRPGTIVRLLPKGE